MSSAISGRSTRKLVAIGGVLLLAGALAYVLPARPRNALLEIAAWGAVVMASFAGWGSLARRAMFPARRADLGLLAAWGASLLAFAGGLLGAVSAFSTSVALAMIVLGVALAAHGLWAWATAGHRAFAHRSGRLTVLTSALLSIALVGVCLHYAAAISDPRENAWDDIAYVSFVRRFLETGTLIEPFSARRMAALGGQTFFDALVASRGSLERPYVFDHGIAFTMVAALVVGWPSRTGSGCAWWPRLSCLYLMCFLDDISSNTASYWSGVAFFLALYRTFAWLSEGGVAIGARGAVLVSFLVAALGSLRPSYAVVAAAFALLACRRTLGSGSRAARRDVMLVGGLSALLVAPWLVMSWRSNYTLLFPLMRGTANPELGYQDASMSLIEEARYAIDCVRNNQPISTLPLFFAVALLVPTGNVRRLLGVFGAASAVGFFATVHAVTRANAYTVSRYSFGFLTAFALATLLDASARRTGTRWRALSASTALLVVTALLATRPRNVANAYSDGLEHAREDLARVAGAAPVAALRYARAQASVPAGEGLVVQLDEPKYLSFARNRIANLDLPGASSLAPGLPYFEGPAAIASYFLACGLRYLAFVRPEHSKAAYRRDTWLRNLLSPVDYFRLSAPYALAQMDAFERLANERTCVFDEQGIVVVDLASGAHPPAPGLPPATPPASEALTRDEFVRRVLASEHEEEAAGLAWDPNVRFGSGWYHTEVAPMNGAEARRAWRWMSKHATVRLRVADRHEAGELVIVGMLPWPLTEKKPVLTVSVNGQLLDTFLVSGDMERRIPLSPSAFDATGEVTCTFDMSQSLQSPDSREIGFGVRALRWEKTRK